MAPFFSYKMVANVVSVAVLIGFSPVLGFVPCDGCSNESAKTGDGLTDDQVLHLECAFVRVESFAVREEASDLIVGDDAVPTKYFSGPRDGLAALRRAERLG